MTPEEVSTNEIVAHAAAAYLGGLNWPNFPSWVDSIATRNPVEMRDQALDQILVMAKKKLGAGAADLPTATELLEDESTYQSLLERIHRAKGVPMDDACCAREYAFFQNPIARQDAIVAHLRHMWDNYLEQEWAHNLSMLRDSAIAWQAIDLDRGAPDIVRTVTGRDQLPEEWGHWLPEVEQLIFIPSAHIGPYLLLIDQADRRARVVFGARTPPGIATVSPALSRSELLTRLSAIADDTRLRILELLAREDEQSAQEVIGQLGISQSSASRHLRQLTATGYLTEARREGAKYYRLNPERLDETLGDLKRHLH
jgi:ArsR family transcriptional regulator